MEAVIPPERRLEPEPNAPAAASPEARYEALSAEGAEATRHGDFARALECYRTAVEHARAGRDVVREDAALVNAAMVLIQLGRAREGEEGLREILLRTTDVRVAFNAAYHLASSLRRQSRHEKALTYARRAMEKARQLDAADFLGPAHNLLGNIFLSQSYLEPALAEYEMSLRIREAQAGDTRYSRAIVRENIGYCLLLLRRMPEGLVQIGQALELAREVADHRCIAECLQDLCYGHLLQGSLEEAARRGEEALEEAVAGGFADLQENCHYLLAEIGTQSGDLARRDEHLDRLQDRHPELPFLKDFLCAVDVMSMITLKR